MSDFLSNLVANVQRPAEMIQPRLGPFYGTSPSPSFLVPDGRARDFAAETEEPASGEPLSSASPWRKNTSLKLPVSARSSDFSRDAQSPRLHDSFARSEMDSHQQPVQSRSRSMPFQRESTMGSSFSPQPSLEMEFKYESPSSPPTNRDVAPDDLSRRNAGEEVKPVLDEAKAARPMNKLNISSEREKPAASQARGDILSIRSQAKPSPPPDFHVAVQRRREERFAVHEPLRSPEAAAPILEPMLTLPQLRPYVEPQAASQDLKAAEKREPIIRVNIGRIEVRAITPPAPSSSPKRARSGPLMSLEDYLKQRNGGQR